ncbi:MAG: signal peptidase II [Phycisphaerae bacterium]
MRPTGSSSALFDVGSHIRLWGVAAAGLALDLWSKWWAFENLGPTDVREAIPSVLSFRLSVNTGALFGMGKGMVSVFIVASFVALVFVFYYFASSSRNRKWLHLALSCILAGSLGNLYDRMFVIADQITLPAGSQTDRYLGKIVENDENSEYIKVGVAPYGAPPYRRIRRADVEIQQVGVVRDFMKFHTIAGWDAWPWVFNVADALLVIGVAVLLISLWGERRPVRARVSKAASPEASS